VLADWFFGPYDVPSEAQLVEEGFSDNSEGGRPIGVERACGRSYGFLLVGLPAALMHVSARFSKFRIFSEKKKKCILCNVCTSVCHQGIDVMNFANKGVPMEDPECVRCSACVQSCPTGVLSFGRYGNSGEIIHDSLPASLVRVAEIGVEGSDQRIKV
jgi:ferredoxin